MKKRKFILNLPNGIKWNFYAESWEDAQNTLFDCLEIEEEERQPSAQDIEDAKEDKAYQDHKEAV